MTKIKQRIESGTGSHRSLSPLRHGRARPNGFAWPSTAVASATSRSLPIHMH